jgi:hypothetical protein
MFLTIKNNYLELEIFVGFWTFLLVLLDCFIKNIHFCTGKSGTKLGESQFKYVISFLVIAHL